MCQVPEQFQEFDIRLHSFLYCDYEYFAWFATPDNDRTMEMFERVLRWKRLTRGIGAIGGVANIWARWQANDNFANLGDPRLVTRVFLLHLRSPIEYPIFDTNVWKAMRTLAPQIAQRTPENSRDAQFEEDYINEYIPFFTEQYMDVPADIVLPPVNRVDPEIIRRRILDRALWEYGRIPLQNG